MKRVLILELLKRSLQLLLGFSLFTSFLLTGSFAYASPGKTYQAHSSKCPTIPANFDFAHASTQELHHYLLPGRPTNNQQEAAAWLQMVKGIKQKQCVPDMPTHLIMDNGQPLRSSPNLVSCPGTAPSGTSCSNNWNG